MLPLQGAGCFSYFKPKALPWAKIRWAFSPQKKRMQNACSEIPAAAGKGSITRLRAKPWIESKNKCKCLN